MESAPFHVKRSALVFTKSTMDPTRSGAALAAWPILWLVLKSNRCALSGLLAVDSSLLIINATLGRSAQDVPGRVDQPPSLE